MRRLLPGACLFRAFGSAPSTRRRDGSDRVDRAVTAKPMQPDPVEAAAKLVSLEGSSHLCFYATSLPLAIGQGASHVLPWSAGDQVLISDPSFSTTHLLVLFESQSRTYELKIVGETGAKVDGYDYKKAPSCGSLGQLRQGRRLRILRAAAAAAARRGARGAGNTRAARRGHAQPVPAATRCRRRAGAARDAQPLPVARRDRAIHPARLPACGKRDVSERRQACASWRAELEEELEEAAKRLRVPRGASRAREAWVRSGA